MKSGSIPSGDTGSLVSGVPSKFSLPKKFPDAGVTIITISLFFHIRTSARSLLSRFGETALNRDFISDSLSLKRHGPPVCEPFMARHVVHKLGDPAAPLDRNARVWTELEPKEGGEGVNRGQHKRAYTQCRAERLGESLIANSTSR